MPVFVVATNVARADIPEGFMQRLSEVMAKQTGKPEKVRIGDWVSKPSQRQVHHDSNTHFWGPQWGGRWWWRMQCQRRPIFYWEHFLVIFFIENFGLITKIPCIKIFSQRSVNKSLIDLYYQTLMDSSINNWKSIHWRVKHPAVYRYP